jgi:hypothetical protein
MVHQPSTNKNMKKIIAITAILVSITFAANAQPGNTTGGFEDDPQDVPVDGGIILLVSAGVAYGYKKMKKNSVQ